MTSRLHTIVSCAFAVAATLAGSGPVNAADDELQKALRAAFQPPVMAGLDLFTPAFQVAGHRFGVAPLTIVETGGTSYRLKGTLTGEAGDGGGRETLAFRIAKRRDGIPIVSAECRLGDGPWRPLAAPLRKALTDFRTGRSLTPDQQQEHRRRFEAATNGALDGTWRRTAEFLIARIALGDGC
jgi:hypothetical protein